MVIGMAVAVTGRAERTEMVEKVCGLWRMQGPRRVVAAAIYSRPVGWELRVYFEPEDRGDVLETRVERSDVAVLEKRAESLAEILREKGWWPLDVPLVS